jgi:hypothetical protein
VEYRVEWLSGASSNGIVNPKRRAGMGKGERALSHLHKLAQFTELAHLQRGEGETRLCGWEFGFGVGEEEEVEVEYDGVGRWMGSALHPCHPTHPLLFSSNRIQERYPWTLACPPHPRRIVFILTYT